MNQSTHPKNNFPDDDTLQAWEDMRIEIWHELQDGASADITDIELDNLGKLIVELTSWRARKRRHYPPGWYPGRRKIKRLVH